MTPAALIAKIEEGLRRAEEHRETDATNGVRPEFVDARAYGYMRALLTNLIRDLNDERAEWTKDREPVAENLRNALQLLLGVTPIGNDGSREDLTAAETLLRTSITKLERERTGP